MIVHGDVAGIKGALDCAGEGEVALVEVSVDITHTYLGVLLVKLISPNVFQARIELPGTAPLGKYDVDVAIFSAGAVVASQALSFTVTKSGAEQVVARAAFIYPIMYGLITTAMALLFGWLASVIFRRD